MNYEKIREKILNKDYEKEATETEWAGCGIALCAEPHDVWEIDGSIDYYCTQNARCFVWLLKLLAEPLYEKDFMNKYDNLAAFTEAIRQAKKGSFDLEKQLLSVVTVVEEREQIEAGDSPLNYGRWDMPPNAIKITSKNTPEQQKLIDEINARAEKK